ncbi:MAG: hypothetical protein IIB59_03520 [Planctomycetes bacterium]|nr:hypothetical protein [Planctomycetota bacterium]
MTNEPVPTSESTAHRLRSPQCESSTRVDRLCKRLCERCGYVESCEDNFVPNQANPIDDAQR